MLASEKISRFLYSMGPGGAERNVANLLPFLVKRYEVHLILMSKVIAYEIPSEVQIHFIENSDPYESGLKKLARLFLAMPMLAFKYKNLVKLKHRHAVCADEPPLLYRWGC